MAVGSFKKSSGIVALAIGLAMSLPAVASAQERQRSAWQQQGGGNRAEARAERRSERAEVRTERRASQADARTERRSDRVQARQQRVPQNQQVQNRVRWGSREAEGLTVGRPVPPQARERQEAQRRWDGNRDQARRDDRRGNNDRDRARDNNNRWSDNDRRWDNNNNNRRWDNNWRRDNRYNWQSYRNSNRNVYRMGRYHSPYRNYNYRRLSIGFSLQPLFYSSSYWISDPWQYRLPEVYGPYRWVRYYDDALLVDIHTGRVVDVINDFFW